MWRKLYRKTFSNALIRRAECNNHVKNLEPCKHLENNFMMYLIGYFHEQLLKITKSDVIKKHRILHY